MTSPDKSTDSRAIHSDARGSTQERPQTTAPSACGGETEPASVPIISCVLCHDKPLPGYRCVRCGTYTPGRKPGNKGPTGQAEDPAAVAFGKQLLADLKARRAAKAAARQAAADLYADQLARHTQHPQSRGSGRKLWSRP